MTGRSIKFFGLALLAAFSLMAVTAVGAQASGELKVEGKALAEKEQAELVGTGAKGKLLVPGLGLTIECESAAATGTLENLTIEGVKHAHGKIVVLYKGCKVVGNKFCVLYPTPADRTAKTNAGHITATALALESLLVSGHYLLIEPLTPGGKLTVLYTTIGGGCTLPAETAIEGRTGFVLPNCLTDLVNQIIAPLTEADEKAMKPTLKYGGEPATLDEGSAEGHLVGKFEAKKFGLN